MAKLDREPIAGEPPQEIVGVDAEGTRIGYAEYVFFDNSWTVQVYGPPASVFRGFSRARAEDVLRDAGAVEIREVKNA